MAEKKTLTEGDYHRLRSESGINQSAGHDDQLAVWEQTSEGKAWLADEDKRQKQIKAENTEAKKQAEAIEKEDKERQKAIEAAAAEVTSPAVVRSE